MPPPEGGGRLTLLFDGSFFFGPEECSWLVLVTKTRNFSWCKSLSFIFLSEVLGRRL